MAGLSRRKISQYEKIITPNSAYFKTLKKADQRYLRILCKDWPDWLDKYIATPEMKRLKFITSSRNYTALYLVKSPDMLRHAVASALIIWNFTKDKPSTIAALLENIATPVFNLDLPRLGLDEALKNAEKISKLLIKSELEPRKLTNILPEAPKIERYFTAANLSHEQIERFYGNLELKKSGTKELAFRDLKVAEDFSRIVAKTSLKARDEKAKFTEDFMKSSIETLVEEGELTEKALYHLTEQDVISLIKKSKNKELCASFAKFKGQKRFKRPDKKPKKFTPERFDPFVRAEVDIDIRSGAEEIRYARLSKI